jgi:hypothetical protein
MPLAGNVDAILLSWSARFRERISWRIETRSFGKSLKSAWDANGSTWFPQD